MNALETQASTEIWTSLFLLSRPRPWTVIQNRLLAFIIWTSVTSTTSYSRTWTSPSLLLFSLSPWSISTEDSWYCLRSFSDQGIVRGRPWHASAPRVQAFSMVQTQRPSFPRSECVRGIFWLVMDMQTDAVLNVLGKELQDQYRTLLYLIHWV